MTMKKRSGAYGGPLGNRCPQTHCQLSGEESNPHEADRKGFPVGRRKGPFLLGAHTDLEGRAGQN